MADDQSSFETRPEKTRKRSKSKSSNDGSPAKAAHGSKKHKMQSKVEFRTSTPDKNSGQKKKKGTRCSPRAAKPKVAWSPASGDSQTRGKKSGIPDVYGDFLLSVLEEGQEKQQELDKPIDHTNDEDAKMQEEGAPENKENSSPAVEIPSKEIEGEMDKIEKEKEVSAEDKQKQKESERMEAEKSQSEVEKINGADVPATNAAEEIMETSSVVNAKEESIEEKLKKFKREVDLSIFVSPESNLTVGDAVVTLAKITKTYNLSQECQTDIMSMFSSMIPKGRVFGNTNMVEKVSELSPDLPRPVAESYCRNCIVSVEEDTVCSSCKVSVASLGKLAIHVQNNVAELLQVMFEKHDLAKMILEYKQKENQHKDGPKLTDICNGQRYKSLPRTSDLDVSFIHHMSATPWSKGTTLLANYLTIAELEPSLRKELVILESLWLIPSHNWKKQELLAPFCETMLNLSTGGVNWTDPKTGLQMNTKAFLLVSVVNTPLRGFMQNVGHSEKKASFACNYCEQPFVGESIFGFYFPFNDDQKASLRTHWSVLKLSYEQNNAAKNLIAVKKDKTQDKNKGNIYKIKVPSYKDKNESSGLDTSDEEQSDIDQDSSSVILESPVKDGCFSDEESFRIEEDLLSFKGVRGHCPLAHIPYFNIVDGFSPEYMQNLLNSHVQLVFKETLERNQSKNKIAGNCLMEVVANKTEQLTKTWVTKPAAGKVLEKNNLFSMGKSLRNWLLYVCLPCFHEILPDEYFANWVLLVKAVYNLLKDEITAEDVQQSERILIEYCKNCEEMFGPSFLNLETHSLLHLAKNMQQSGPLWSCSAFTFQDALKFVGEKKKGLLRADLKDAVTEVADTFNQLLTLEAFCKTASKKKKVHFSSKPKKLDDFDRDFCEEMKRTFWDALDNECPFYTKGEVQGVTYTSEEYSQGMTTGIKYFLYKDKKKSELKAAKLLYFCKDLTNAKCFIALPVYLDSKFTNKTHGVEIDHIKSFWEFDEPILGCAEDIDRPLLMVGEYLCIPPNAHEFNLDTM